MLEGLALVVEQEDVKELGSLLGEVVHDDDVKKMDERVVHVNRA